MFWVQLSRAIMSVETSVGDILAVKCLGIQPEKCPRNVQMKKLIYRQRDIFDRLSQLN